MERKKELEENYIKLNLMKNQLNNMLVEKNILETKINEISTTIETIEEIKKLKKNDEVWSSVGSGAYMSATIKDPDKIMINIGANTLMKKTIGKAEEFLEKKDDELKALDQQLTAKIIQFSDEIKETENKIRELAGEK